MNSPGPYVVTTIALAGFALFAAVHHLHLWLSRRERSSLLFAAGCVPAALLCLSHATVATATTVEAAQRALDIRTTSGLMAHLAAAWLVAAVTGVRARIYLRAVTVLLLTGAAVNLFAHSLVGAVSSVDRETLPWGETVALMARTPVAARLVWIPLVLYAGVLSVQVYALLGARSLWARDRTTASLMGLAGVTGLVGVTVGLVVDTQIVRGPYAGQLSVAAWIVLMAVLLSREHAKRGDLLEISEQRFRAIFDQTFQLAWLMHTDGRLVRANRTALQLAGIREQDVIGRLFWETPWWTHAPDQQERLRAAVRRAASGETVRFEATHRRPDGQLAYIDFSLKPVVDERGQVTLLIPEGRDLTERQRAEQALAVSEARFRTLIESAPEAIVVFDLELGYFTHLNQQACVLFELSPDELRTMTPAALSPPTQPDGRDSRAAAQDYLDQAAAGGVPVFEWTHRTRGGRDIPCEVRLVRLPDPARTLVRGSITDISMRRQLEHQLRQSQKMEAIGQLAGGVAHDFNNLLTVIAGYTELLGLQIPTSDPRRELVGAIQDATTRAAWLTERLLAFGRRAVLTPEILDLNSVVRDAEGMLRRLIGEDVQLTVTLHDAPNPVRIDPGQWSQVILNLAINARDAMPQGGRLSIATSTVTIDQSAATAADRPPGTYARLSVSDTGLGMSPEVIGRLFEPFFTTKPVGKGTGLGLAVVHGIVMQAGGFIDVASTPGAGTTFSVHLPLVGDAVRPAGQDAPASEAATSAAASAGGGRTETILLVEDDDAVRRLIESALRQQGFSVLVARDGPEALHLLDTHPHGVDLLISDVVMPGGIYGHQLGEIARSRYPGLKALYMSGYVDVEKFTIGGPDDGVAFLQKPFSIATFARKVREMLDRE